METQTIIDSKHYAIVNKHQIKKFNVENWCGILQNFTAETHFIDIEIHEAQAIVDFYKFRYQKIKRYSFTKEQEQILKNLETKIDDNIKSASMETGFFGKFSLRSPKDGFPLDVFKIEPYFEEELTKLKLKWNYEEYQNLLSKENFEGNLNMMAFGKCMSRLMKCHSGKELLNIILSSERVCQDLSVALEYQSFDESLFEKYKVGEKIKWDLKIFLRRWDERVDCLKEFRCFVNKNRMTVITQYNHILFIPDFQTATICDEIKSKIFSFWEKNIKDLLDFMGGSYVVDCAILPDGDVQVIELNHFESSETGLFKWIEDTDVLYGVKYDESKSEIENIACRVRREVDMEYGSYWEDYMKYIMKEIIESTPYYEVFNQ